MVDIGLSMNDKNQLHNTHRLVNHIEYLFIAKESSVEYIIRSNDDDSLTV